MTAVRLDQRVIDPLGLEPGKQEVAEPVGLALREGIRVAALVIFAASQTPARRGTPRPAAVTGLRA